MIRGAHLARSIIENKCLEGLERIFRQTADLRTQRRRKGRLISASLTLLVIDKILLWLFANSTPNEILTIKFDLEILK
jgi:hypothetical protein